MHTFKDHEITRDPSTQPITTKLPRFSACRSDILRHDRNQLALRTNGNRALTSLNTVIIFCDDTARTTNDMIMVRALRSIRSQITRTNAR